MAGATSSPFALFGVLLLIVVNLRGVRESVVPLIPIMPAFRCYHVLLVYTLVAHIPELPEIVTTTPGFLANASGDWPDGDDLLLLCAPTAFGAGTYTGIEAVSNGLPIIREPKVDNGKRTMWYMAISLAVMVTRTDDRVSVVRCRASPGRP